MQCHRFALWVLVAGTFFPGDSIATTVRHLDTPALARSSRAIVVGQVESVRSFWNAARTKIYTAVDVRVLESLKGDAGARVSLIQLGGEADGVRYDVPGCPLFTPGEEALLFVWQDGSGRSQVNGLGQGKFEITRDPLKGEAVVQRAVPGLEVGEALSLRRATPGSTAARVTLAEMKREIANALASPARDEEHGR